MSSPEPEDFPRLIAAHANGELSAKECEELRLLARMDREHMAMVAEIDEVHMLFEQERELFHSAMAPVEPAEEADAAWQQLARAAAASEEGLRSALLHSPRPRVFTPRRTWTLLLAAAAVFLVSFLIGRGTRPPDLLPQAPGEQRLGHFIMLAPRISQADRSISWQQVVGARSYDVLVLDDHDKVMLRRAAAQARSTEWNLTPEQFLELEQQAGMLYLRVVARDGAGIAIGSSGDQPLAVR